MPKYEATKELSKILIKMDEVTLESFLQSDTGQLCLASVIEYNIIQELNRLEIKTRKFEEKFYGKLRI